MYRPTLRQLEFAVALAEHRHFGRTADAVHVSQPGLSSQIKELEERLGVELFERDRRNVHITPCGEALVTRANEILRLVDELLLDASMMAGKVQGRFRLAAIPTMGPYLLPALREQLKTSWPFVELVLFEMRTAELLRGVKQGDIDMGLIALPFDTGDLHVEVLQDDPFVLACADGHDLAGTSPVGLSALRQVPVLLLEEGHCLRDQVQSVCTQLDGVAHREVHHASLSTLVQMVAGGVGVTLLPASAVEVEARAGSGVSVRPLAQEGVGRTIALVWRRSDPRSQHFVAFARTFQAFGRAGNIRGTAT